MLEDFKVQEFIIIGTQADPGWFTFPIRYAHEDASDGVVRVAAGNLNFNHLVIQPNDGGRTSPLARNSRRRAGRRGPRVLPGILQTDRAILRRESAPGI